MPQMKIGKLDSFSNDFVPQEYRVNKNDLYYFRNIQSDQHKYRSLKSHEIEVLVKNNNTAENWDKVLVSDNFDPSLVRNCEFWGMVRVGALYQEYLEFHKLRMPVGLNNCTIISCDIGDHVALRNVRYLSHYVIGNMCMLFNIDEMHTVDNAKFGNGIVKEGEPEDVRIWLEIGNENGGRRILPFEGILPADAYLWSKFREDSGLLEAFKRMTDELADTRRGYYGSVGECTVIKNCRIIKDVKIGSHAYIKGANKLKNLTIQSTEEESTQIGEGVELVNGIVGYKNRIFYGVKAVRFVTGRNVQLKYGARLINSLIGPNSTVSCCEILNNLIFPFHEQHHNNSFLIASTIQGQSNIAAGATIGSNHNSRAADGEILAERGFWPGLQCSFKHNSVFAAFTLVAKGSYPAELNITLPFSLISPGPESNSIQLTPGFWFRYNMYALARNAWKFKNRDTRFIKDQNIEMDYLAPDTAEQMLNGMNILKSAIEDHLGKRIEEEALLRDNDLEKKIHLVLNSILNRGTAYIQKPVQGYRLYRMMLLYYGARELIRLFEQIYSNHAGPNIIDDLKRQVQEPYHNWYNLGGQLVPEKELQVLIEKIRTGKTGNWSDTHAEYNRLWADYPVQRMNHAIHCLLAIHHTTLESVNSDFIRTVLEEVTHISETLLRWTVESREKDYTSKFRKITYRNQAEMEAVLGSFGENSFIQEMKTTHEDFRERIHNILKQIK